MLLKFYGPEMCRNRPDVGNIFMHFLCIYEMIFCPSSLTISEHQQVWDQLNCNQKHFLMWYAITINCIYINKQVASIFQCNFRSDSELERQFRPSIFRHSRQARFRAGGPKFRASGPKFCTGSICTSSKFLLVHLDDDVRDASRS